VEFLAGVDEVGRGCLAGPVVVAAAILPAGCDLPGVRDSKKLSPARREQAFELIRTAALSWAAVCVSPEEIDRRNILQASLVGMSRALGRLRLKPELALIDGHLLPPSLPCPGRVCVRGDDRSMSIAAASVLAKVARDRLMRAWDRRFPGYGWQRNVGYPTPEHLVALGQLGPTQMHRQSFAPVKRALSQKRMKF
jgi:ribonuclease HII